MRVDGRRVKGINAMYALVPQFLTRRYDAMNMITLDIPSEPMKQYMNEKRRALALTLGADYALDPTDPDFVQKVHNLTKGKGVRACVEVTGVSAAMKQALECAAREGRICLLGCTRVSDCAVDYYSQVHKPGVTLIGAHNMVRPKFESYPHHWTHQDDCKIILDLLSAGRIVTRPVFSRAVKPEDAPAIYTQLCEDKEFPLGTVFDWR